jgi:hypothetical protein
MCLRPTIRAAAYAPADAVLRARVSRAVIRFSVANLSRIPAKAQDTLKAFSSETD